MPVFKSGQVGGTKNVLYGEAVLRGPTPYHLTTEYRIISESKKTKSPKKYYPCIHFLVPLFNRRGIIFLDYYILLCNIQIGTFADMDTDPIVSLLPCLRCKFLAEMPPVLISQSLTIYSARQFYLSSDTRQHTNPKPFSSIGSKVQPQLKPLKMHCNTVHQNVYKQEFELIPSRGYYVRNKSFDFRERLKAIHSASKIRKYLLKNCTFCNRLLL